MSKDLGKVKKVDLRSAWKHEAADFTEWLAKEENLSMLSDELGISIKLIQTEATVGRFSLDILAEDENNGKKIIIENQLESTNHDHLGKIITYASGFDASMVIWVVKSAREEHRQAIDWLNEHTDEEISMFLVRVELWQIGDSPFAPKFDIISQPNDWAKSVKKSVGDNKITDTKAKQFEFWEQFKEYAREHKTSLRLQKSYPQHWTNISIGNSNAHISLTLNSFDDAIRTELYIPDNKDVFHFLKERKKTIEKELGYKVEWMELQGKKASRIKAETSGNIDDTDSWEEYFKWMQETAEKFQKVFAKALKKYK